MIAYGEHFGALAARYDALRGDMAREVLEETVAEAGLAGATVVDIGCGTGRTAQALTERYGCSVIGVDASTEMLAVARNRTADVRWLHGRAEALPLPDGIADSALFEISIHLMDPDAVLPEARRVATRLVVRTIDPTYIDKFWLADLFPSWAAIDKRRFRPLAELEEAVRSAGYASQRSIRWPRTLRYTRERALTLLRERYASSFALMDEEEIAAGITRAEATLPDIVETQLGLALILAE